MNVWALPMAARRSGSGSRSHASGAEHGLLEEPPRAAGDVAGGELILDAREQRLHVGIGDEAEHGRLVGEDGANEVRPADRRAPARSKAPYEVPTRCAGPCAERLDELGEVVLVAPPRRRARAVLAAAVAPPVVADHP